MNRQPVIKSNGPRMPRALPCGTMQGLRRASRAGQRRGGVTMGLLVVLTVVLGFVALAWNVASLRHTHNRLQAACESAALAGAAQLVDPSRGGDRSHAVLNARQAALAIATFHRGGGKPLLLVDNPRNLATGDVVIGSLADPALAMTPFTPWNGSGDVNTIRVRAERSQLRGNAVGVWFGQMLGALSTDVSGYAQASIDRRVYGYRPMSGAAAPVVPLVVDRGAWTGTDPGQTVTDNFTVDIRNGLVLNGSDGITELTVTAYLNGATAANGSSTTPPTMVQLALGGDSTANNTELNRQITQGLNAQDLRAFQGALVIPSGGCLAAAYVCVPAEMAPMLWSIRGQPRAWPLAVLGSATSGAAATPLVLVDFAGATVVDVQLDTENEPPRMVVTLQPMPLASSCALAAPGAPANPWLAKLMLTR